MLEDEAMAEWNSISRDHRRKRALIDRGIEGPLRRRPARAKESRARACGSVSQGDDLDRRQSRSEFVEIRSPRRFIREAGQVDVRLLRERPQEVVRPIRSPLSGG